MTTAADDSAVEEAFEAYLAGRAVPAPGERLGAFADAVRASATEPGRPSGALADLLATGLLIDSPSPSTATARPAPGRRRRIRMFLPALFAKIVAAGMVAKAAAGAGIVVVGLTTVGFTGHLPGTAQHTFATVVDSVTPLTAPDTADTAEPGDDSTTDGTTADTTADTTDGTTDGTTVPPDTATKGTDGDVAPEHPANFGRTVSTDAKDGGVDGQQISREAHEKNQERKGGTATTSPAPSPAGTGDDTGDDTATPAHGGGSPAGSGHGKPGH
jgi:hypothetical protein